MKSVFVLSRAWLGFGVALLLGGTLQGCGHDPNHDVDMEKARAAARRVHTPPDPSVVGKMGPGHGG